MPLNLAEYQIIIIPRKRFRNISGESCLSLNNFEVKWKHTQASEIWPMKVSHLMALLTRAIAMDQIMRAHNEIEASSNLNYSPDALFQAKFLSTSSWTSIKRTSICFRASSVIAHVKCGLPKEPPSRRRESSLFFFSRPKNKWRINFHTKIDGERRSATERVETWYFSEKNCVDEILIWQRARPIDSFISRSFNMPNNLLLMIDCLELLTAT